MQGISDSTGRPRAVRLEWVDMAKGLALIGIIISHTSLTGCVSYIDNMLVPVFWVCAGFTSKPDFSIRRKGQALLRPYFIMAAICLVYALIFTPDKVDWRSVAGIVYSRYKLFADRTGESSFLMMRIHDSVLWFLTSLFTAYCLLKVLFLPNSVKWQSAAAVASLFVGYLMRFLPVLLPWSIDTAFFIAPQMWCAYRLRRSGLVERCPATLLTACVVLYVITHAICGETNFSIRYFGESYTASAVNGFTGAVACMIACRYLRQTRMCRFMAAFNRQALYIFGLQLVFFSVVETATAGLDLLIRVTALIDIVVAAGGGWLVGAQNSLEKWKRIFGKSD